MSSKPTDAGPSGDHDRPAESDDDSSATDAGESSVLTLNLPEGSASVSEAIITHREMLNHPQDHGLATDEDITHLSEAMETLSADVDEVDTQYDENQSDIEDIKEVVERQHRQIEELQSMVTSLAEILGTETEWQSFDEN